jgi:hypothetical protein
MANDQYSILNDDRVSQVGLCPKSVVACEESIMTQQRAFSWRTTAKALLAVSCILGLIGCRGGGATRVKEPVVHRQTATREKLLGILEQNMSRLATLTAKANVTVTDQAVLVPASLSDEWKQSRHKLYQKKFLSGEVNGLLLIARGPDGKSKVNFQGTVTGLPTGFILVGREDQFWVVVPNLEPD